MKGFSFFFFWGGCVCVCGGGGGGGGGGGAQLAQSQGRRGYLDVSNVALVFLTKWLYFVFVSSETVSVGTFHYIHNNLVTYHEMLLTNKKEGVLWSKR